MKERPHVALVEPEPRMSRIEKTCNVSVADGYALWMAGGTRGVNDIGQVLRKNDVRQVFDTVI